MISSWAQERYNQRFRLVSANTANNTLFKTGVVKIGRYHISNTGSGAAFVKIYDKATAPVAGTDTPILTIGVTAGATTNGLLGLPVNLGFGIAITGVASDSDTTAVAANQVVVNFSAE